MDGVAARGSPRPGGGAAAAVQGWAVDLPRAPHGRAGGRPWRAPAAMIALLPAITGCTQDRLPPLTLKGGPVIGSERLERGREAYLLYCRSCHGDRGDGRGAAAIGLRPPPRNFTDKHPDGSSYGLAFKFGGVEAGSLPPDGELERIVLGGLAGTAMIPWQIPRPALSDVLQYIKTFNPVWTTEEVGQPIVVPPDPWEGRTSEAIARGRAVYHGVAQCTKCHPAYVTRPELWAMVQAETGHAAQGSFRESMYDPEPKYSETFRMKLVPPDFTRSPIKAGATPADLYRTIAAGVAGTAMPTWKGALDDRDLWAVAHYVSDLADLRGTPDADALRRKLLEQPSWTPSAEPGGR